MSALILASQSPRRKELLTQLGYKFSCQSADVDESILANESPQAYVQRVATAKAQAIFTQLAPVQQANSVVLAADTSVIVEQSILGKPQHFQDFETMFAALSNREHTVLTAISAQNYHQLTTKLISTKVFFKRLTTAEIQAYWQTGEPQDKAGGYGIQGLGGQFITRIEGSYSAVVGLPLYETVELLTQFGLVNPMLLTKEVNK